MLPPVYSYRTTYPLKSKWAAKNEVMSKLLKQYFKTLYERAMQNAYSRAHNEIVISLKEGGSCLDCGAYTGQKFALLNERIGLKESRYIGIEWNTKLVQDARKKGLNVVQGDLNREFTFQDNKIGRAHV